MEERPSWEANSSKASQEIPSLSLNLRVHNSPLSLTYCFKSWFNIIIPLMPRSSKSSFSLRFSHKCLVCTPPLCHTCGTRSTTTTPHALDNIIISGKDCKWWSSSLCSFLQSLILPSSSSRMSSLTPYAWSPLLCVLNMKH